MISLHIKYQPHCRLIYMCFHKNFEFHVAFSIQTNNNFLILMTSPRRRHQHDYRLIDGCFHKNLEIQISSSFLKTEETSVQGNRNFRILMMYSNYGINISVIIGSMMAASTKTLQFISFIFKHCHSNLNASHCNGFCNNVL